MAITGIDTLDGKQIIAAGASSATNAYKAELTTGGNSLQGLYDTVSTSSGTWGAGGSFPASADEACGVVTANSANWNSTKTTVNTYSGLWNDTRNTVGTNSANWGAAAVVTATGGTTAYVQTINGKNISATNAGSALSATNAYNLTNTAIKVASATSASTAYTLGNTAIKVASATSATNANTATYASNGVSLTNIYNSARSGYAASAYIAGKEIVNGRYQSYDSYNNPNWWTGNNIFGLKLNSASVFNSTGIGVEGARIDGLEMGMNGSLNWMLYVNFIFNKFIPIDTGTWRVVASNFFSTTAGHFVAPIYSTVRTNWDSAPFGAVMIDSNTLWTTDIKLTKFEPYTGYTANKVFVNFTIPWAGV